MTQNKATTGSIVRDRSRDRNCSVVDEIRTQKTFEDTMNMNPPIRRQSLADENSDSLRNGHRKKQSMTVYLPTGPEAGIIEAKDIAS